MQCDLVLLMRLSSKMYFSFLGQRDTFSEPRDRYQLGASTWTLVGLYTLQVL